MFNLCSVCVIALLVLSASRADEDADADDEGLAANPVSAELGAVRSVCKPVPNTTGLCSGIGYGEMRLPNLLGHASAREAQQQSAAWMPLLGKYCHRDTRRFLCSLYAPVCLPEVAAPVRPCRTLCEAVRDACLPVMSAFGFRGRRCSTAAGSQMERSSESPEKQTRTGMKPPTRPKV